MGTKMKCPCNKYLAVEGTLLCECEYYPKAPLIPREQVMEFAEHMELKLKANDHKQSWRKCSDTELLRGLQRELDELLTAIRRREPDAAIISECADVANYAMMLADKRARWGEVGRR